MKERLSTSLNQQLLQKRNNTILKGGAKITIAEEESALEEQRSSPAFMGIIPLRCKLGGYFYLNLDDDHVAEHLFWFGSFGYERSSAVLFTHLAKEAHCVLDLGSYTGYFSVLSSVLAKNSNTFSVEANPLNFHRLSENLRINGSDATPYNCAITPSTDSKDTITILYNAGLRVLDTGTYAAHEQAEVIQQKLNKKDSFIVPALSFSSLISKYSIPVRGERESYTLIKLDVEGLEAPLLEDIADFFLGSGFMVLIEILTPATYRSIYSLLSSRGDLSIAYINEHKQEAIPHNHADFRRKKGSRNFLLGSNPLIQNVCGISLNKLLAQHE